MKISGLQYLTRFLAISAAAMSKDRDLYNGNVYHPAQGKALVTSIEESFYGPALCHVSDTDLSVKKNDFLNNLELSATRHHIPFNDVKDFLNWDQQQDRIVDIIHFMSLYMRDCIRDRKPVSFSYDVTSALLTIGRRKAAILSSAPSFVSSYSECFGETVKTYPFKLTPLSLTLIGEVSQIRDTLLKYISGVTDENVDEKFYQLQTDNDAKFSLFLGEITGIPAIDTRLYTARASHVSEENRSYPEYLKDWINLKMDLIDDHAYRELTCRLESSRIPVSSDVENDFISVLDGHKNLNPKFLEYMHFSGYDQSILDTMKESLGVCSYEDAYYLDAFFNNLKDVRTITSPSALSEGEMNAIRFTTDDDFVCHKVVYEAFRRSLGMYSSSDKELKMLRSMIGI